MQPAERTFTADDTEVLRCGGNQAHGAYRAHVRQLRPGFTPLWSRCPQCSAAEASDRVTAAAERRARAVAGLLSASGVSGRYARATFETFAPETRDQQKALAACRAYADRVSDGIGHPLLLLGSVGTGKTHLACAIVQMVIERQCRPSRIVTVSQLVREIRSTWRSDDRERTEEELLSHLAELPLLVIDDLGANFNTAGEEKHLLDVIDGRYTAEQPTVIVSNLDLQGVRAALGERAFDRIREGAQRIDFTWASHRGKRHQPTSAHNTNPPEET